MTALQSFAQPADAVYFLGLENVFYLTSGAICAFFRKADDVFQEMAQRMVGTDGAAGDFFSLLGEAHWGVWRVFHQPLPSKQADGGCDRRFLDAELGGNLADQSRSNPLREIADRLEVILSTL